MRFDVTTMFSEEQTLSGASTDSKVLDMGAAGLAETHLFVAVRNIGPVTGLASVALKGSSDGSTWKTINSVEVTDLTDGGGASLVLPQGCPSQLKLVYTGTSMSGKVTAGITLQAPSPRGKRIGDYAMNPQ